MTKQELKQYENVSIYDIIGACVLGSLGGAVLALTYIGGF
jgi:hypothetical protein